MRAENTSFIMLEKRQLRYNLGGTENSSMRQNIMLHTAWWVINHSNPINSGVCRQSTTFTAVCNLYVVVVVVGRTIRCRMHYRLQRQTCWCNTDKGLVERRSWSATVVQTEVYQSFLIPLFYQVGSNEIEIEILVIPTERLFVSCWPWCPVSPDIHAPTMDGKNWLVILPRELQN